MKMKKNIFIALSAAMLFCGCGEDYADTDIVADAPMAPVQNVEATSFVSSVILTWDLPENDQYYYTMVSYVDAAGQTVNRKVSKYSVDAETPGRARALIGGFTDTNEYEFTLTAYSYAGNASTPVTVKGTPEDRSRAKDYLVETVTFDPQVEAVNINWTNELNADVNLVLISLDYFNIKGNVDEIVREVEATTPHVEVIDNLPIETDIEVKYYMVDNETGEKSETKTATFQVLPTIYDIYDAAVTYIPESYYGINMMTIDWNETKNEFHILTSGNDPYVYTKMPATPAGTTLIFRYRSMKNITNFEIFLNGRAPGGPNEVIYQAPDGYKGLRLTNGYWKTVVWDLSDAQKNKFDFINNTATNQNRIRIDFGSQNTRELWFRNMHWE